MMTPKTLRTTLACGGLAALLVAAGCGKKDEDKPAKKPTDKKPKIAKVGKKKLNVPKAGTLPTFFPLKAPYAQVPKDNPQTPDKIELGHQLFFDKRLSADGSRSCYSCHQNEDGNGGHEPLAIGAKNKQLTRHSPVIWNVAYMHELYWDGRSKTMEAQVKGAWGGGNMGVGKDNLAKKAAEIAKIPGYAKQFKKVFPKAGVTPDTIAKAIAAFERTLICKDTAYDKYAAGDAKALTDEQKQGLALFMGKAQCTGCHAPPMFSSSMALAAPLYQNVGIGTKGVAEDKVDVGRMKITKKDEDWAAFKIPSLRNVSKSAPYFHDGSAKTLKEAVKLMAGGGIKNKNLSKLIGDRNLSDEELDHIVAFLKALDCNKTIDEPKLP